MASVSDSLIYVGLQREIDFEPAVFPLLYVVTAVVYMVLAIPVGRLADRVGRVPVLLGGHALLFLVYGALLLPSLGYFELILSLVALGAYFAATEGVITALAGAVLPEQASGERDRDADHRGQPRAPALLARLRRALAGDRAARRRC